MDEQLLGGEVLCPTLVGREGALAAIRSDLERTEAEAGRAALVTGEAGIGKSRLIHEIRDAAEDRGWITLEGSSFEHDRALPFAPFLDLLHRAARSSHGSAVRIAEALLGGIEELDARGSPELIKHQLFEEVTSFVTTGFPEAAVLVMLEDLHWADEISLELVVHLARAVRDQPAMVLLTCRREEPHPKLVQIRETLRRARLLTEISLQPLDRAQVEEMIAETFQMSGPVRSDLVEVVWTLSDGNPFLVEESLRSLVDQGLLGADGRVQEATALSHLPIPESMQAAVEARLDRLEETTRHLLAHAAVIGRRVDIDLLAAIAGLEERDLLDAVREAVQAHFLTDLSATELLFRHEITRRAIHSTLLAPELRTLHLQAARTLATRGEPGPERTAQLARHFSLAEEWEEAAHHARIAGHHALRMHAPEAAILHLERAMEATRRMGSEPSVELVRSRARAYEQAGRLEEARSDLATALDRARRARDRAQEWACLLDLGGLWMGLGYELAGEHLRRALEVAEALEDPQALGTTLNRLGNWLLNRGEEEAGIALHHRALEVLEGGADPAGTAGALDQLGFALYMRGDMIGGEAPYRRAAELFEELGDRAALVNTLGILSLRGANAHADTFVPAAPLRACEVDARRVLDLAREIRFPVAEAFALANLGSILAAQGRFGEALDLLRSSLRIAEEIEHATWVERAHYFLGLAHADMGNPDARHHLTLAVDQARDLGITLFWATAACDLASLEVARGRPDAAEAILTELESTDGALDATMTARRAKAVKAELALATGDPTRARELADDLIRTAPRSTEGVIPRLAVLSARAAIAADDPDRASITLRQAVPEIRRHAARPWELAAAITEATALAMLGRRQEAEQMSARAEELISSLAETVPDQARAQRFVEVHTARLPKLPRRRRDGTDPSPLSPRQWDVARLVAEGLTNREIATELFISLNTVETHVKTILRKLGFSSRTQIASWVTRAEG